MRYKELVEADPEFKHWFGDSKVVDKKGQPLVVHHGTNLDFETFLPLSHFGTARSANDRLSTQRNLYGGTLAGQHVVPVYLSIRHPLRVTDADASGEATLLNSAIRGQYPDLDVGLMRRHGAVYAAEQAGYDGFVYSNRMEDAGRDSWVIFRPDQVRSALA